MKNLFFFFAKKLKNHHFAKIYADVQEVCAGGGCGCAESVCGCAGGVCRYAEGVRKISHAGI